MYFSTDVIREPHPHTSPYFARPPVICKLNLHFTDFTHFTICYDSRENYIRMTQLYKIR